LQLFSFNYFHKLQHKYLQQMDRFSTSITLGIYNRAYVLDSEVIKTLCPESVKALSRYIGSNFNDFLRGMEFLGELSSDASLIKGACLRSTAELHYLLDVLIRSEPPHTFTSLVLQGIDFTRESMEEMLPKLALLNGLVPLKYLCFDGCDGFDNMKAMFSTCKDLQELHLRFDEQIKVPNFISIVPLKGLENLVILGVPIPHIKIDMSHIKLQRLKVWSDHVRWIFILSLILSEDSSLNTFETNYLMKDAIPPTLAATMKELVIDWRSGSDIVGRNLAAINYPHLCTLYQHWDFSKFISLDILYFTNLSFPAKMTIYGRLPIGDRMIDVGLAKEGRNPKVFPIRLSLQETTMFPILGEKIKATISVHSDCGFTTVYKKSTSGQDPVMPFVKLFSFNSQEVIHSYSEISQRLLTELYELQHLFRECEYSIACLADEFKRLYELLESNGPIIIQPLDFVSLSDESKRLDRLFHIDSSTVIQPLEVLIRLRDILLDHLRYCLINIPDSIIFLIKMKEFLQKKFDSYNEVMSLMSFIDDGRLIDGSDDDFSTSTSQENQLLKKANPLFDDYPNIHERVRLYLLNVRMDLTSWDIFSKMFHSLLNTQDPKNV
jgi:hypothetical protein